eukprot:20232-Heterococcus_DN1.PRE.3
MRGTYWRDFCVVRASTVLLLLLMSTAENVNLSELCYQYPAVVRSFAWLFELAHSSTVKHSLERDALAKHDAEHKNCSSLVAVD